MNYLFLLAILLFPVVPAWAGDAAAPELLALEKKLTAEQKGKANGGISPEQYQAFLDDFRPELTDTMSHIPPSSQNTATHSRILVLLGEHGEAVSNLTSALKKDPDDSTLRLSLGQANLEKKDYAGALAAANAVLETDPKNFDALRIKHESLGRGAPSIGSSSQRAASQIAVVDSNAAPGVYFSEPAKRKPIVADLPDMVPDVPASREGRQLPLLPLAAPLSLGLIGYGLYRNQRSPKAAGDEVLDMPAEAASSQFDGPDRNGRAAWGQNEPRAPPAEVTPEQIATNRRRFKATALTGAVLLGGYAIATFAAPIVLAVETFFVSLGPAAGGGLVPAYAGVGGGAAAATLNPVTAAAGAKALGAAVVVVGEARVASDYYVYSKREKDKPPQGESASPNAKDSLDRKLRALEQAQKDAEHVRNLPDRRVRYYGPEKPAQKPGFTRGRRLVTELDSKTGQVRQWMESYDHSGRVVRVHPKMIDGQVVESPHYPPTGKELAP